MMTVKELEDVLRRFPSETKVTLEVNAIQLAICLTDPKGDKSWLIKSDFDDHIPSYEISICDDCYNLKGEMCHQPGCVFIRHTMEEVGELLDTLMIRPVIDGVRHSLQGEPNEIQS